MTHLINIEPRRSLNHTCLKLWIADYFDEIINKIDIYTENIIVEKEYFLNDEQHNDINIVRKRFLQIAERSQLKNFGAYDVNVDKIKNFLKNIDISHINQEQMELIKSILFESFCVLLFDISIEKCFKLIIMILDWYLNEYQHEILRLIF